MDEISESIWFIIGYGVGAMFSVILFVLVVDDVNSTKEIIANKYLDYNNIRYNVVIDSTVTDSLFGKTWRK